MNYILTILFSTDIVDAALNPTTSTPKNPIKICQSLAELMDNNNNNDKNKSKDTGSDTDTDTDSNSNINTTTKRLEWTTPMTEPYFHFTPIHKNNNNNDDQSSSSSITAEAASIISKASPKGKTSGIGLKQEQYKWPPYSENYLLIAPRKEILTKLIEKRLHARSHLQGEKKKILSSKKFKGGVPDSHLIEYSQCLQFMKLKRKENVGKVKEEEDYQEEEEDKEEEVEDYDDDDSDSGSGPYSCSYSGRKGKKTTSSKTENFPFDLDSSPLVHVVEWV